MGVRRFRATYSSKNHVFGDGLCQTRRPARIPFISPYDGQGCPSYGDSSNVGHLNASVATSGGACADSIAWQSELA